METCCFPSPSSGSLSPLKWKNTFFPISLCAAPSVVGSLRQLELYWFWQENPSLIHPAAHVYSRSPTLQDSNQYFQIPKPPSCRHVTAHTHPADRGHVGMFSFHLLGQRCPLTGLSVPGDPLNPSLTSSHPPPPSIMGTLSRPRLHAYSLTNAASNCFFWR